MLDEKRRFHCQVKFHPLLHVTKIKTLRTSRRINLKKMKYSIAISACSTTNHSNFIVKWNSLLFCTLLKSNKTDIQRINRKKILYIIEIFECSTTNHCDFIVKWNSLLLHVTKTRIFPLLRSWFYGSVFFPCKSRLLEEPLNNKANSKAENQPSAAVYVMVVEGIRPLHSSLALQLQSFLIWGTL